MSPQNSTDITKQMSEYPAYDLIRKIREVDEKFRKARIQIILLNNKIEALIVRYNRCTRQKRRSCRYAIRMQVATVEGVRNMYYEYARRQCQNMDALQRKLKELTGEEYYDFEEL